MASSIRNEQYQMLAELRYQIRLFLQSGDVTAQEVGIEPQQYQLLLAIRGMPAKQQCTIRALSERLLLKHHSTVELIDRMETNQLVVRARDQKDRRQVFIRVQPKGEKLLNQIVQQRIEDLHTRGRTFINALTALLDKNGKSGTKPRARQRPAGNH